MIWLEIVHNDAGASTLNLPLVSESQNLVFLVSLVSHLIFSTTTDIVSASTTMKICLNNFIAVII